MTKKSQDKQWQLKITWALSVVMLIFIAGFFYQAYEEMREIAPVKVAVERIKAPKSNNDRYPK